MDTWLDPAVHTIVFQKPSRVGGTAAMLNCFAYAVACDPGPYLWLWPDLGAAGRFSELELDPMFRDTPALAGKLATDKTNQKGNKILQKVLPGGSLTLVGVNKPAGLAQLTVRYLFCDEINRYPQSAGKEGSPIELARRRLTTFPNKKLFLGSSPTRPEDHGIETYYQESDQRVFEIPCPHCDFPQEWRMSTVVEGQRRHHLKWDGPTDPTYYVCEQCGGVIEHHEKTELVARGRWRATAPFNGVAGFRISGLISPWWTWNEIRDLFLAAKPDDERLRVFVNTVLGETFNDDRKDIPIQDLRDRQDVYHCEAPDGVLVITAGVDVQHDRIEIQIVGWGVGWQCWVLGYEVVMGDPVEASTWAQVETILLRTYQATHGVLKIACAFVDAKDGNRSNEVYAFCKEQNLRKRPWYASGGGWKLGKPLLSRPSRQGKARTMYFEINVNAAKDTIDAMLKIETPGPKYINFPSQDSDRYQWFGDEYFLQLRAEQPERENHNGKTYQRWKKVRKRNEALDTLVYALAAAHREKPNFEKLEAERLAAITPQVEGQPAPVQAEKPAAVPTVKKEKPARPQQKIQPRKGFLKRW